MKLQTKITIGIIPLVLCSLFVLGLWSMKKTGENLHQSAFLYMDTIIDSYMQDIDRHHDLLKTNGLNAIPSFVAAYQNQVFAAGRAMKIADTSHLFIMDGQGELVFCSKENSGQNMEPVWGPVARAVIKGKLSSVDNDGHVYDDDIETMYVVRVFSPWNWVVFFAMDHEVLHAAERQIQMATTGIAVGSAGLLILIILLMLRRFFVNPVRTIGRAASAIAKGRQVDRIDVRSKDELGDLARHMEAMSAAIQQQQAEIIKANQELEQRVKERTRDLETALSEIKTLRGIIPICSHCKKIRDDDGYWNQLETYIRDHSEAQLSHGICRECAKKYYPDLDLYDDDTLGE
ncbi:HAMP domain-containing protein [Desulfotignum phosphitoxidans]|uniref:histidine kinase n=1 Tax=Desulfotignum phosphitoxidans DSM 13687 TaxID=1286635 RepID=S0G699_9BACT|nr:HAMP domain-containing protein [Desulfotignum phosphitoxidans]EMS79941.1 nitrate/nitrite-specific extracellular solute-binding protein [Desulfotignum phosphitoxidans DSM 13687]